MLVTTLVLPSLLLLVTPSRKGDERDDMIEEVTPGGEFDYEPHTRDTAMRQPHAEVSPSSPKGDPGNVE